jgi:hypothetical protein
VFTFSAHNASEKERMNAFEAPRHVRRRLKACNTGDIDNRPISRRDHRRKKKLSKYRRRERIQEDLPAVSFHGVLLQPAITCKTGIVDKNLHCPIQLLHFAKQPLWSARSGQIENDHLRFYPKLHPDIAGDVI